MDYTWGILVVLVSVNSVLCKDCDLNDADCLIRWANVVYPAFTEGATNIRSSDPLYRDLIEAEFSTLKYVLRNAVLTGMKDCSVTNLIFDVDNKKFNYYVECPHFVIKADHEVKGDIAGFNVDVKGSCTITADDYIYKFSGDFERIFDENGKKHIRVINYEVDAKANGNLVLDFKNDYDGSTSDFKVVQKFVNENWKDIDEMLRKPAVNSFMALFMENVNQYLVAVPFEPFVPDE